MNDELLLQNIPGKVAPGCSQQLTSSITLYKVNISRPGSFEIKVRKFLTTFANFCRNQPLLSSERIK